MTAPLNNSRTPPFKIAGAVLLVILAAVLVAIYFQFRGDFTPKTTLTMIAARGGMVMDPGSKVTDNGVEIGRVATVEEVEQNGKPKAKITLEVNPRYINQIPAT
jgi:phospholipid/cholesterol/gamma-HCH transport system substrate-binding protein